MNKLIKAILVIGLLAATAQAQIVDFSEFSRVDLNQQLRVLSDRINIVEDYTISGGTWTGGTITASSIYATDVYASTIYASTISGGTISGGTITGGAISGATITGGDISGATITATTGQIGGWYINSTSLADNATPGNANILLDAANGLIRAGTTAASYITLDGANRFIRTSDYVSGPLGSGWHVGTDLAEFNNIRVRGKFTTSVFEKDTISSIGGNFLVADSDILDVSMVSADATRMTITGDTTFVDNDILRIKDGVDDEWFTVTDDSLAPIYGVTRDGGGDYTSNMNPNWKKGTAVVNYGASGEGLIFMTASEANAPHIDVLTHAGAPWDTTTTRMRLGNLNGYLGYSADRYGIAIGESAKYLKYDPTNGLQIKGIVTIESGSGGYANLSDKLTDADVRSQTGWSHVSNATLIDGGDIYANSILLAAVGSEVTDRMFDAANTSDRIQAWAHASDATLIDGGDVYAGSVTVAKFANDAEIRLFTDSTAQSNVEAWQHASNATLIDGGDIYTSSVTVAKLNSDATVKMFSNQASRDSIEAWQYGSDYTKIDGGDIYTRSIIADKITVNSLTAGEIAGAAIEQIELNTAEAEQSISLSYYADNGGGGDCLRYETDTDVSLPAGLYGLHPQVLATWDSTVNGDACTNYDSGFWEESYYFSQVNIQGEINNDIADTYTTYARLRLFTQRDGQNLMDEDEAYLYSKFRYITSSNEDTWVYLKVAKDDYYDPPTLLRKGQVVASSYSSDHPSIGNDPGMEHPFGNYDESLYDVVLVDNEVLDAVSKKVTSKRSALRIINEDYEVDWNSKPTFKPVDIQELDPIGDRPGTVIETEYNVPVWAQPVYGKNTVEVKRRTISTLPSSVKYRKLKKKAKKIGGQL